MSISKKLYLIVGAMAILIALELFTLWFAINTLSSVRALVGAEGLYSKAQKDGIYKLVQYSQTHNEANYREYLQFMSVPEGDHITRLELIKPSPDLETARKGFLAARIHPDDIDGMISLLRRFNKVYYINKAIQLWTKGDSLIGQLLPIGDSIHASINSGQAGTGELQHYIAQIDPLNRQLTKLEDDFSYTLGEGSRWLENFILKLLFFVALTVEITGLIITISVSRNITKGLNEIIRATGKIAKGDLSEMAAVYSGDEIGQVATAVNVMTKQLVTSNSELGQFANIASHDLQEPLRTISNYITLYQENYREKLDDNEKKYLDAMIRATTRMQLLIKSILDYSQIGHDKTWVTVDVNVLLEEVLADMAVSVKENNVSITIGRLPVIHAFPELRMLFQNLLSNAIKFKKTDIPCVIKVSATSSQKEWVFAVADNGIGIEKAYHEQIFSFFKKLHSRREYQGAGIGLAHCMKIVELHGGKLWVDSRPGEGSTFRFTIPQTKPV